MHPNFPLPANEEGVLWRWEAFAGLRVPVARASSAPRSPIYRRGFGTSAGGAARRLSRGQGEGSGLTGPRGTSWWARPPNPLLQTRGPGEHGAPAGGLEAPG